MSIIHDALKKVQTQLSASAPVPPKQSQEPPPARPSSTPPQAHTQTDSQPVSSSSPPERLVWGLGLFLCAVVIISCGVMIHAVTRKPRPAPPLAIQPPLPAPAETLNLNVTGVSFISGKKVVLIDDKIYEPGDTIQGMTLIDIGMDTLTLRTPEGEKTLSIR